MISPEIFFLQGPAGIGKTTFLRKHGLEHLAVSKDILRLMCGEVIVNREIDHLGISQAYDKDMKRSLLDILEHRLFGGLLTIVDATHTKKSDFDDYKKMVDKYNFKAFIVPINPEAYLEAVERNSKRQGTYAYVPPGVIVAKLNELEKFEPPAGYEIIDQATMVRMITAADRDGIIDRIIEGRRKER